MGRRFAAYFALATASGLVLTWAATWMDLLAAGLAPRQLAASHIVAELATAGLLVAGAVLSLRADRAHWLLAAALGALGYATLNVLSDFGGEPVMQVVLVLTLLLTAAALYAGFGPSRHRSKGSDPRGGVT